MNPRQTDSKTSVLIFVSMLVVFGFVQIMAKRFVGPAWADPFAQTALLAFFSFLFAPRVNGIRTVLNSVFALAFFLVLNYVRLHERRAIYDGLMLGIGAAVAGRMWWCAGAWPFGMARRSFR